MKIKIKPNNTMWPPQYLGQEVEVDVTQVVFPDGTIWVCTGYDVEIIYPKSQIVQTDLKKILGDNMVSLHVDYRV
jgi:hypothetical protein